MPIYDYACDKCEHEFEVEQRITDDPVKTCPACRSRKVKRLIPRTSFVLKGGGWYSDLYSSSGDKKPEKKSDGDSSSDKSEKGKSEGKADGAGGKSEGKGGDGKAKGKGSKAAA